MVGFTKNTGLIGHMLPKAFTECLTADLAFQSHSDNLIGYLSVGAITGIGTISSYVIEWHLNSANGPIVFLSGYNTTETIDASHPFTNEPVQSGNLYAVVRFIVINGVKYSPYRFMGQYSPDLKLCFNYVRVADINCSNGIYPTGTYTHYFAYSNTVDPSDNASRELKFMLNSDGSTNDNDNIDTKFLIMMVNTHPTGSH